MPGTVVASSGNRSVRNRAPRTRPSSRAQPPPGFFPAAGFPACVTGEGLGVVAAALVAFDDFVAGLAAADDADGFLAGAFFFAFGSGLFHPSALSARNAAG